MNNDTQQRNRTPWQTPQIRTLSISLNTEQDDPKDPPLSGEQS